MNIANTLLILGGKLGSLCMGCMLVGRLLSGGNLGNKLCSCLKNYRLNMGVSIFCINLITSKMKVYIFGISIVHSKLSSFMDMNDITHCQQNILEYKRNNSLPQSNQYIEADKGHKYYYCEDSTLPSIHCT